MLVVCLIVGSAITMSVDEVNGFIYWGADGSILRSTLTGGNVKEIIDRGKLHIV